MLLLSCNCWISNKIKLCDVFFHIHIFSMEKITPRLRGSVDNPARRLIVRKASSGKHSHADLARQFGTSRRNVSHIVNVARTTGRITKCQVGGTKPCLLSQAHQDVLADLVEYYPTWTLTQLNAELHRRFPTLEPCSDTTIHRYCKLLRFTMKRIKKTTQKRDTPELLQIRQQFVATYLDRMLSGLQSVVFIDEMGINLDLHPRYGRSTVGEPIYVERAGARGSNITAITAMSEHGVLYAKIVGSTVDRNVFCSFLSELFATFQDLNWTNCMLVMDRVPFHRSPVVTECIDRSPHERVLLPQYSPDWNAAEYLFHVWKDLIRTQLYRNQKELVAAMTKTWKQIKPEACKGMVNRVYTLMEQYR
eukprot:Rmarinus@m.21859